MRDFRIVTGDRKPPGPYIVLPKSKHLGYKNFVYTQDLSTDPRITSSYLLICPSPHDNTELRSYVDSKLFKFFVYMLGGFDGASGLYLRRMPWPDCSRVWTDRELYDEFGLTPEECEYVELINSTKKMS